MSHYLDNHTFALECYQGPLDFLLYLIQKNEIEITDIPLQQIIEQFLENQEDCTCVDTGAEFIGITAYMLWLKSKVLLPKHLEQEGEEEESDPRFEILRHLIDYCRFKEVATKLSQREEEQKAYFSRGIAEVKPTAQPKGLGIEHLSLQDFATLFQEVLTRAAARTGEIHEEFFRVSDKLKFIRTSLKERRSIPFKELFTHQKPRVELIVTFLAILELMKLGETCVVKDKETDSIMIIPGSHE